MKPLVGGLVSGIVLGLFLKLIQFFTNLKVYTLLLNVDYVLILKNITLPEIVEFSLHLVISIVLAVLLGIYIHKKGLQKEAIPRFVMIVSIVVGLLLYPTTLLSGRTPSINDGSAFLVWLVGHWVYGIILGRILSTREGDRV